MKGCLLFVSIIVLLTISLKSQSTCSIDWAGGTVPINGTLNNSFTATATNIAGQWKTTTPTFGSFASGRPFYSSTANTLLRSSRGGGVGAKTIITFASPVDSYRLHISDMRGDAFNSEMQQIEAYSNNIAVGFTFSTLNASLVSISGNTVNGSTTTTTLNQGEVTVKFNSAVDSIIVKSIGLSDYVVIDLLCPDGTQSVKISNLYGLNVGNNRVVLNWNTFQEYNCKGFLVQKSDNGLNFDSIGFVPSVGQSNSSHFYNFNYYNNIGSNYFRLIQYNLDGSYTLSNTILLNNKLVANVYVDNNFKSINIQLNENRAATILVSNIDGKQMVKQTVSSNFNRIETNNFSSGIYIVTILQNTFTKTYKIFVP